MEKKSFSSKNLSSNPRLMIFGKTGSGKSFFAYHLLKHYSRNFKCIIMDTKNEYTHVAPLRLEDFGRRSFIRRATSIKTGGKIITDLRQVLEVLAGLCCQFKRTLLYIEELPAIIPKNAQLYRSFPNTAQLLLQGRANYQCVIAVAQAPADTNLSFVKQADNVYLFRMEPLEEQAAKKITGVNIPFEEFDKYEFWDKDAAVIRKAIPAKKAASRKTQKGSSELGVEA